MEAYMKVEAVLRYIKKNALALPQYKIGDEPNHFFKCSELAEKLGAKQFRLMKCELNQYLVKNNNKFTLYWLSGLREVIEGYDFADALRRAGYGNGALRALDFYANGDNHQFVFQNKAWVNNLDAEEDKDWDKMIRSGIMKEV